MDNNQCHIKSQMKLIYLIVIHQNLKMKLSHQTCIKLILPLIKRLRMKLVKISGGLTHTVTVHRAILMSQTDDLISKDI